VLLALILGLTSCMQEVQDSSNVIRPGLLRGYHIPQSEIGVYDSFDIYLDTLSNVPVAYYLWEKEQQKPDTTLEGFYRTAFSSPGEKNIRVYFVYDPALAPESQDLSFVIFSRQLRHWLQSPHIRRVYSSSENITLNFPFQKGQSLCWELLNMAPTCSHQNPIIIALSEPEALVELQLYQDLELIENDTLRLQRLTTDTLFNTIPEVMQKGDTLKTVLQKEAQLWFSSERWFWTVRDSSGNLLAKVHNKDLTYATQQSGLHTIALHADTLTALQKTQVMVQYKAHYLFSFVRKDSILEITTLENSTKLPFSCRGRRLSEYSCGLPVRQLAWITPKLALAKHTKDSIVVADSLLTPIFTELGSIFWNTESSFRYTPTYSSARGYPIKCEIRSEEKVIQPSIEPCTFHLDSALADTKLQFIAHGPHWNEISHFFRFYNKWNLPLWANDFALHWKQYSPLKNEGLLELSCPTDLLYDSIILTLPKGEQTIQIRCNEAFKLDGKSVLDSIVLQVEKPEQKWNIPITVPVIPTIASFQDTLRDIALLDSLANALWITNLPHSPEFTFAKMEFSGYPDYLYTLKLFEWSPHTDSVRKVFQIVSRQSITPLYYHAPYFLAQKTDAPDTLILHHTTNQQKPKILATSIELMPGSVWGVSSWKYPEIVISIMGAGSTYWKSTINVENPKLNLVRSSSEPVFTQTFTPKRGSNTRSAIILEGQWERGHWFIAEKSQNNIIQRRNLELIFSH
jgi:hypothetical protein